MFQRSRNADNNPSTKLRQGLRADSKLVLKKQFGAKRLLLRRLIPFARSLTFNLGLRFTYAVAYVFIS